MTLAQKQVKNMVFRQLDLVVKHAKLTGKSWKTETLPLSVIKDFLAKAKPAKVESEEANNIIELFNTVLDSIYDLCAASAEKMETTRVPIKVLEIHIKGTKETYLNALK